MRHVDPAPAGLKVVREGPPAVALAAVRAGQPLAQTDAYLGDDCLAGLVETEDTAKWEASFPFDETLTHDEYFGLVGGIRD
jgi:hypothetical protein